MRHDVQVCLHVVHFTGLQLQDDFCSVAVFHFVFENAENLAVDILVDFFLIVAALLQSVKKLLVIAPQNDDQIKPALREKITRVELQDDAALLHEGLEFIANHVFVEFGHVKLLVPSFVQLL